MRHEGFVVERHAQLRQARPHAVRQCTKGGSRCTGNPQHAGTRESAWSIDRPRRSAVECVFDGRGEPAGTRVGNLADESQCQV